MAWHNSVLMSTGVYVYAQKQLVGKFVCEAAGQKQDDPRNISREEKVREA